VGSDFGFVAGAKRRIRYGLEDREFYRSFSNPSASILRRNGGKLIEEDPGLGIGIGLSQLIGRKGGGVGAAPAASSEG
jgi:hypothetical protein